MTTTALRPSRPVFTPPPAEDPRPWIPPTPSGPKVAARLAAVPSLPSRTPGASNPPKPTAVVPVAFTTASKAPASLDDLESWTEADFETMRILAETVPPFLSPAGVTALASVEARLAALPVIERTPGPVAQVVSLLHRRNLPSTRRWRAERRLEGLVAERRALIGVAA